MKDPDQPSVSIIILQHNRFDLTKKCIDSVLACDYTNYTIFVVDNDSDIQEYRNLKDTYENAGKIFIIRNDSNLGFSSGNNRALKKVDTKYFALLNNDTEVEKNWLKEAIAILENDKSIGGCQPKLLNITCKNTFDYGGACGGFCDILGFPYTIGRIFFTTEEDSGQYDTIADLNWCSGAAFILKSELLPKIGMLSEVFFMYTEDIDFSWKILRMGYRLVNCPQSIVFHHGGYIGNLDFKRIFWTFRNFPILLSRHYPLMLLVLILPFRFFTDSAISIVSTIRYMNVNYLLGIVGGYLSFVSALPGIIRFRIHYSKCRLKHKIGPSRMFLNKHLILFQYFFKDRKKCSDIPVNNVYIK